MGMTDPLPLRTCSRCENWYREYADGTEILTAMCVLLQMRKYGSDTCSKWVKK